MILASDVATVSVSFKSVVVLPLPLGEGWGEGLADAPTKTISLLTIASIGKKKKVLCYA
jgi:hypothetical protein